MRLFSDRTRATLAARLYGFWRRRPNLRWPAKPGNGLVPWYTILWRAVWWVPILVGLGLTTMFVAFSLGVDEAEDFWRRAR